LIITLWMVLIVGALAVAIGRYLSLEVKLTKYRLAREQAKTLARSGVYLGMQRVALDAGGGVDWAEDVWAFSAEAPWRVIAQEAASGGSAPQATIEITIADEERRLDVNGPSATAALLDALSRDGIGPAIVQYRDDDNPDIPEEDDELLNPPYIAKDRPIRRLEELFDIPAINQFISEDPETFVTWLERITVYAMTADDPPQERLNLNTLDEDVLREMKRESAGDLVERFLQERGAGPNGDVGDSDDCLLTADGTALIQDYLNLNAGELAALAALADGLTYRSSVFRISAKGIVSDPSASYRVEAVVRRSEAADERPTILAWREG